MLSYYIVVKPCIDTLDDIIEQKVIGHLLFAVARCSKSFSNVPKIALPEARKKIKKKMAKDHGFKNPGQVRSNTKLCLIFLMNRINVFFQA
jgi:hypothetical protein